jgi:hypothetical protein
MDGVHIKIVSERAGHASVGITWLPMPRLFQTCRPTPQLVLINGSDKHLLSMSVATRWQVLILTLVVTS